VALVERVLVEHAGSRERCLEIAQRVREDVEVDAPLLDAGRGDERRPALALGE